MRACDVCGTEYQPKRPTSKYCGPTCRTRACRAGGVVRLPDPAGGGGSTVVQVRAALRAAGREDSYLGASALVLAEQIDSARSPMGLAPLVKQLQVTMGAALEGALVKRDELDELRERRDRKLSG
jgi:hypothetical protein